MSLLTSFLRSLFSKEKPEASAPLPPRQFAPAPPVPELPSDSERLRHMDAARERFPGPVYQEWLPFFHNLVKPKVYLEIGVETGRTLAMAMPPTLAVGVDPVLQISHQQNTRHKLFPLPSDDFFEREDMHAVFEGQPIDMAFIDGLHTFDQALKDFINVERHAHRNTLAIFHDIFPVTPITANRTRQSAFWVGDTWKVVCILRKFRPDLHVFTIPTYPSGLAIVTGLNSSNGDFAAKYDVMVEEGMAYDLHSHIADMGTHLNEFVNDFAAVEERLRTAWQAT